MPSPSVQQALPTVYRFVSALLIAVWTPLLVAVLVMGLAVQGEALVDGFPLRDLWISTLVGGLVVVMLVALARVSRRAWCEPTPGRRSFLHWIARAQPLLWLLGLLLGAWAGWDIVTDQRLDRVSRADRACTAVLGSVDDACRQIGLDCQRDEAEDSQEEARLSRCVREALVAPARSE